MTIPPLFGIFSFLFTELKNTIETQVNELKSQIESKCSLQWGVFKNNAEQIW